MLKLKVLLITIAIVLLDVVPALAAMTEGGPK